MILQGFMRLVCISEISHPFHSTHKLGSPGGNHAIICQLKSPHATEPLHITQAD
jgi:hypothetical protein